MRLTEDDDRYRVLRRLGAGGMAEVVLAQDTLLDRYVALKRVRTANDSVALKRLQREATVGASITHPNVVRIYDVWEKRDGDAVIVMEYVPGDTLQYLIRTQGALPAARALPILGAAAAALDAVHARGIVHRDVKPANILVGIDGTVKLADLGIAAVDDHTKITTAGQVIGTFSYMAPEQLDGHAPRPSIDVYALAAVAFEALSGTKARPEPNPLALAHAIATRPPPDLRDHRRHTPAAAAEVLRDGMARDPAQRPGTAGELIGRLRQALEPAETREEVSLPSRSRPPASIRVQHRNSARRGATQARAAAVVPDQHVRPRWRRRRASAVAVVACLAIIAAVVGVLASGGTTSGSRKTATTARSGHAPAQVPPQHDVRRRSAKPTTRTAAATPKPSHLPTASGEHFQSPRRSSSAGASVSAPGTTTTPSGVVQSFYEAAARHDYTAAWELADENMRNQLAGFESFKAQMSRVRVITFHQAETVHQGSSSAAVSLDTTAVLLDRTQHCTGSAQTIRTPAATWLLDHISINCTSV